MPTYEYRCPKGHHFELFQKMSEEPRADCPECGQQSERLLSGGVGFLFKGDGFYITENRSDSYRKDASKESSPLPSEKGGDTGSSGGPRKKAGSPGSTEKAGSSGSGTSSASSTGGKSSSGET